MHSAHALLHTNSNNNTRNKAIKGSKQITQKKKDKRNEEGETNIRQFSLFSIK